MRKPGLPLLTMLFLLMATPVHAQAGSCSPPPGNDSDRLACDIERSDRILQAAAGFYGLRPDEAIVQIVDTVSASGSAYVYLLTEEGGQTWLEAGSVPDAGTPSATLLCHLRLMLEDETAKTLIGHLTRISEEDLPAYGPREDVVVNPDGSRRVRLALESHDLITSIRNASGRKYFSRHAGSSDPVIRFNRTVTGISDQSSEWNCLSPTQDPSLPIHLSEPENTQ